MNWVYRFDQRALKELKKLGHQAQQDILAHLDERVGGNAASSTFREGTQGRAGRVVALPGRGLPDSLPDQRSGVAGAGSGCRPSQRRLRVDGSQCCWSWRLWRPSPSSPASSACSEHLHTGRIVAAKCQGRRRRFKRNPIRRSILLLFVGLLVCRAHLFWIGAFRRALRMAWDFEQSPGRFTPIQRRLKRSNASPTPIIAPGSRRW